MKRREGITIGNPPKYMGYEDELHKVLKISEYKETTGALLYECFCKKCGDTHLRNATQLKRKRWSKDCRKYRPYNWSGLEPEDRIMQRTYGITLEDYESLMVYQNGKCAICESNISTTRNSVNIDHCHTTGKVRGLLCPTCNMGLGQLGDNVEALKKAVAYLESPPAPQLLARAR